MTAPLSEFARDVRAGLLRSQKQIAPRWFYDPLGSALFEAITLLPEYGLTRADARIVAAHARAIVGWFDRKPMIAELGSGSGAKTRALLEAAGHTRYVPIDVSAAALALCRKELARAAEVRPVEDDYIPGLRTALSHRPPGRPVLLLFLGSTIGNFEPAEALSFLRQVRDTLTAGDALLLGTDLVKPVKTMRLAYDDPAGVTAAFNLNLLGRMNRELGADFDLRSFRHEAVWNPCEQRIEMHLRAIGPQQVGIPAAHLTVGFDDGETIRTECCHKFRPERIGSMAAASGFELAAQYIDREWPFAENLLSRS